MLDFGCGGGSFLARMHERSWQVTGLDVSHAAVQRIRNELGLDALFGTLPHPQLEPGSFDVITMWHSLEHVHSPLNVLREAHRLLARGGRLYVAVPNIDSLPFRWFGSAWYGLDLPRHLTHFSPWTLQLMLERAGFTIEVIPSHIDEPTGQGFTDPRHYVHTVAWLKAAAVAARKRRRAREAGRLGRGAAGRDGEQQRCEGQEQSESRRPPRSRRLPSLYAGAPTSVRGTRRPRPFGSSSLPVRAAMSQLDRNRGSHSSSRGPR